MKVASPQPRRRPRATAVSHRFRCALLGVAVLSLGDISPDVEAQVPPAGVMVGTTLNASLRNAAAATEAQANAVANTAQAWGRQANSRTYTAEQLRLDFNTVQLQFSALRERFNWMAYLVLQMNRPQAENALAEMDAALNMILELLVFLEDQFNAGTLDRPTVVRTCRLLDQAVREWNAGFKRSRSRLGFAW